MRSREKSCSGEKGGQDVEEIPICSQLAVIELLIEGVMEQRKEPGCCESVGMGIVHPRARRR